MKIVFFEVMPTEEELLRAQLPAGPEYVFSDQVLNQDTIALAQGAQVVSIFVKSEIRQPLLAQLPDLGLITTRSMGMDHIDTDAAKARGIIVANVQTYAAHPVAEFTFALLLSLSRKVGPAGSQMRERGDFDQRSLRGFNLFGKTLGVVGTGRIGKNVIMIAKGFGMNILAYDPMPDEALAASGQCVYTSLDRLAAQSDIITIHAPYTKENHHLISATIFATMKKGTTLINTARGELVDTHALLAALKDGTVVAAGLDVLEGERDLKDELAVMSSEKSGTDHELLAANHVLIDLPQVIVTPHIAYETTEAMHEILRVTAESISNFIAGK